MKQILLKRFFSVGAASLFALTLPQPLLSDPSNANNEQSVQSYLETIDHPVSTKNPEAQKCFNIGLTYVFAYNHDYAFRQFEKASQLDPNLAMAYWGMALALGQNINVDVTPENEVKAYGYIQTALSLLSNASPVEQAYIKALAQRYTNDPSADLVPLRFTYRDAMKKVASTYPEDLDAACLYAESILNLDPWKYWTWDGKPKEGTMEAIHLLKSVLNRNPFHVGANHFYIHCWEESPTPEEALSSAFRLTQLNLASGHLLHMPCHIFILCGYYNEAVQTSKKAIAADHHYIKEYGIEGEYPLHYLPHNLRILSRVQMLSENYEKAMEVSNELNQFVEPYFQKMPHLLKYRTVPMEINLYFHRWQELLAMPKPPPLFPFTDAYWHFSRAMAYLQLGNKEGYQKERELMVASKQKIKPDEEIANNPAVEIINLAEILLDAAVAHAQNNQSEYINQLHKAVDKQDRFDYDEPPPWYVPIRIELGKALMEAKRYQEAEEVFKKGLSELQRNGRLLFGLTLSLKAQGQEWNAFWTEWEAKAALKNATQPLTLDRL